MSSSRSMSDDTKPTRVVTQRAVVRHGQVVDADSPEAAAEVAEAIARSHARAERRRELWGEDNTIQIVRLARSFPTLRNAAGLAPWDVEKFLDWLCGPAPSSGAWHAGLFVLSVWNQSTDWPADAQRQGAIEPARHGRYDHCNAAEVARRLGVEPPTSDREAAILEAADAALTRRARWRFSVADALSVWDEEHREAFLAWCQLPFWP